MANVKDNKQFYDSYNWSKSGEEWSLDWGSTFNFWYGSLITRIGAFLPANDIVEIGCGYGRISRYLANYCERLQLFDISERCVTHCNDAFADKPGISAMLNDGYSLKPVQDESVDLLFSIYSLVHADAETLQGYLDEAARILRTEGVCFVHHSNCAVYLNDAEIDLDAIGEYRDTSVSSDLVRRWAEHRGLRVLRQELVNWGLPDLLSDCFSIVVRKHSHWQESAQRLSNLKFYDEMKYFKRLSDHYQTPTLNGGVS